MSKTDKDLVLGHESNQFRTKIEDVMEQFASKNAVEFLRMEATDKYTFAEIKCKMIDIELKLNQVGLIKGDRIAMILPHSPWSVVMGITLVRMNVTNVLIDASLPINEIGDLIEFADVQAIITTEAFCKKLEEIRTLDMPCFVLENQGKLNLHNGKDYTGAIIRHAIDAELDVIAILFSSGTTDQMKGVKITYKSVILARDIFAKLSGLESHMTYLLVLPFNHIAGFTGAMTYFLTGCTLGFIEDVNASKLQDGLLRFQPHYFAMVPKVFEVMEQKIRAKIHEKGKTVEAFMNLVLSTSGFLRKKWGINIGKSLFKNIRNQVFGENIFGIGVGASPCKKSTAEFFLNLGLEWANLYATTETGVPITATGVLDRYPVGTVGNVNHHNEIKVRIANPDEKGIGEIQVDTEMIMKGYFRQPELTELAFDGEWFKTGDYGRIDENGYLYITRNKMSIVF